MSNVRLDDIVTSEDVLTTDNTCTCQLILKIGNINVDRHPYVTNVGCVLDSGLDMSQHASRVCKSAYYHLHCIRKIGNSLPTESCKILMYACSMHQESKLNLLYVITPPPHTHTLQHYVSQSVISVSADHLTVDWELIKLILFII